MKSKTIYLLRHGETNFNKNGMVQGRGVNASLNDNGRLQARKVGRTFFDIQFDLIYTSTLVRTHETVAEIIKDDVPVKSHEGFDEISWGDHEGKEAVDDTRNLYAEIINKWRRGELTLSIGGGENPIQVMKRQQVAMLDVMQLNAENTLICMHGRAMRILLCWLLNYPLNYMDGFPHQNCSYYVLGKRNSSIFLKYFNETKHLSDVL